MASEAEWSSGDAVGLRPPLLFHITDTILSEDMPGIYGQALESGFDGVEISLSCETVWGRQSAEPREESSAIPLGWGGDEVMVGAVAARCSTVDIAAAVTEVTALLHGAAFRATCLNLRLPPLLHIGGAVGFSSYQDSLNFAYKLLERIRFEAEATGVAVAFEAGADGFLMSPVELREIVDAANSHAVGVCLDATRIARFGLPDDWIRTLKHRVHSVRVSDLNPTGPTVSGVDQKAVNLPVVGQALRDIGYGRAVIASGMGHPIDVRARLEASGFMRAYRKDGS